VRLCIVTCDVVGPVRNGGIGTAYTALAEALAAAGHDVTILYALGSFTESWSIDRCIEHYRQRQITFVPLPRDPITAAPDFLAIAWDVHRWLRERNFDVVHAHEWRAPAFYALTAKSQGLSYAGTRFVVGMHSPSRWHARHNLETPGDPDDLALDWMERECVRRADTVVSPSAYLLEWARGEGWSLPDDARVIQNLLPSGVQAEGGGRRGVEEIVFFGRLETRKGLTVFCDAIARLSPKVPVTFLGKPGTVGDVPAERWLGERTRGWRVTWKIEPGLDRHEAQAYLSAPGRLAVMASLAENSPYTVLECLAAGVPFLASDVGGIPELIASEHRSRTLFAPDGASLARVLASVLTEGVEPARAAVPFGDTRRRWLALHDEAPVARATPAQQPLVSVCLIHHDRPRLVEQALASLHAQDYPHFEVVLVDDGSTQPEARAFLDRVDPELAQRGWRLVRQEPAGGPCRARNRAAEVARGEWLLFMDDDNLARPSEISTFVRAALATSADVVTCQMELFRGDVPSADGRPLHRWLFTGGPPALGVFRNCFGDTNALVRRSLFQEAGGFTPERGVGEDWELWARLVLAGARLETVPEALFWYRLGEGGERLSGSGLTMRGLRPYLDAAPPALHGALEVAHGAYQRELRRRESVARERLDVDRLLGELARRLEAYPPLLKAARFCKKLLGR
jgi:glycosyltransferase involved in cell wall biosynthesis